MARPTKQGIDYFPLDCVFDDDLQLFITENGAESLGILVIIWQIIYQNEGYYAACDKRFPLKVKQRISTETSQILHVINAAVEWGIFDNSIFKKYNILTSSGIQKRYIIGSRLKKVVNFYTDLMLIDVSDVRNGVNIVGNPVNVVVNATNVNVNVKVNVKVKGDSALETIALPGWLDQDAWDEFKQHRKDIKKPLTLLAAKKNLAILEKHKTDQRAIIDNTIANRWTGLFPPKGKPSTFTGKPTHDDYMNNLAIKASE